jgi:hypothetical protein
MSWRVGSPTFYAAPGATIRIAYSWGKPGDKGPVGDGSPNGWRTAHGPCHGARGKRVDCTIGSITVNRESHYGCGDPKTAYWSYYADFRNDGSEGCRFQLEGGGV